MCGEGLFGVFPQIVATRSCTFWWQLALVINFGVSWTLLSTLGETSWTPLPSFMRVLSEAEQL